ncbi:MAG: hypothetical protein HYX75_09195 [Acidobacteria bacterium]|nr:hypothetical protein [Acidobacteriota bacterium]
MNVTAATPESAFIFSVFESLLSGLVCLVYLFLLVRAERGRRSTIHYFLVLTFFLYTASLLLKALFVLGDLAGRPLPASSIRFIPLRDGLETAALVSVAIAYIRQRLPRRRIAIPLVTSLLLVAASLPLMERHIGGLRWSEVAASNVLKVLLLLTALTFYILRRGIRSWVNATPLVPLLVLEMVRLRAQFIGLSQTAQDVFILASLILFATILDRNSRDLYVQVFVRLNLIFILLAGGLILTITESERRHYLSFAELNLEELSEFLRGHGIYYWKQGEDPEQIVVRPEITRKIVSEFGRVPALRRVRFYLGDVKMEMTIFPDGMVDQILTRPVAESSGAAAGVLNGERIATLVNLPIVYQQRLLGRVELDESLETINARIADQILVVFLTFTAIAVVSGALIGLTVRGADRTIRRQYQELEKTHEQLLHAAKLASVGQLADGVAHEINNPAGIILARTDYLASVLRERGGMSDIHDDVDTIRRQARRISAIVGGLLTFSRPSALDIRWMDLNELVTECLALLAPKMNARRIDVRSEFQKNLPPILGDHDRLEQVLVNILNNAIEAMPDGGRLTAQTRLRPDGRAVARVADSGSGIPEEHLKRIFDPFFTTKEAGRGTGLGLSISYGIVRDHGGTIEVSSAVNAGTTFDIVLPLREEQHDWV